MPARPLPLSLSASRPLTRTLSLTLFSVALAGGGCVDGNPLYIDPTGASTTGGEETGASGESEGGSASGTTSGGDPSGSATSDGGATETTAPTTTTAAATDTDDDPPPVCGDGVVDPGEACDDGDDVNDDGCSIYCTLPACGDEIVQIDEECDHGLLNGEGDSCTEVCAINVCGDGVLSIDEECDDGGVDDGDGCSAACKDEKCGNGVVEGDELCDDANMIDVDACTSLCVPPPALGELTIGGLTQSFGLGAGELGVDGCDDGVLVGLSGAFDTETGLLGQVRGRCVGLALEPIGGGVFRLRQAGAVSDAAAVHGALPASPSAFSSECLDPTTLLWGLGGYTTLEGISEIALQCAEIRVKPGLGGYDLFPQPPMMLDPVGTMKGMLTPPIKCGIYPGTFAGGFEVEVEAEATIAAIRLACVDPGVTP